MSDGTNEGRRDAPAFQAEPGFSGSYDPADVTFLLRMVSPKQAAALAEEPLTKERLIQSGKRHYSEMITPERAPSDAYRAIFERALSRHAGRAGRDVARLARAIDARVDGPITLCGLVRAGVPPGVALTRALRALGRDVAHFGLSIVRDRGIDARALAAVLERRPSPGVLFVDGWTGKGAIADELERTLADHPSLVPRLVVLADPAGRAWLAASEEDWLVPSGILGGTVSGLVSRSILNPRLVGPDDFHASVRLDHLAAHDVSRAYVDRISAAAMRALEPVSSRADEAVVGTAVTITSGTARARATAVIDAIAVEFGIGDRNRIKPGLAEATRAVLRRAPARILVGAPDDADLDGLRHLAARADVPLERRGDALFPYRAITLIADASRT